MGQLIRFKRGTKANLDSLATNSQLLAGEPYFITDENRIAVGLTASTYEVFAKVSEAGGGGGGIEKHVQSNLSIDGNNGNYFIVSINSNSGFTLSNIVTDVNYTFLITNTHGSNTITITLPASDDVKPVATVDIPAGSTVEMGFIYLDDTDLRYWQVSEELM